MKGLGLRIKTLRKARRLTLVEIAAKTGIDQATLSRIENGKMSGTIKSHMKIADVLGVPLPELYEKVMEQINETKEKIAKRKLEVLSRSTGVTAELLATGTLHRKMVPTLVRLAPKAKTGQEHFPANVERFIFVLEGSIEAILGDERRVLNAGQTLYFNASLPHQFNNVLKSESQLISVVSSD